MFVQSENPTTNEPLARFDAATPRDIDDSIRISKVAQKLWASLSPNERRANFRRLADLLKQRSEEILALIELEAGRVRPDAEAELFDVIDAIDYYLALNDEVGSKRLIALNEQAFPETRVTIGYEPYGVVALIMPWNFPFYVPMILAITSTVAGNSILIKPSEYTTMVGMLIEKMILEAGFPKGLVQILPGADDTGKALVKAGADKIFFVGSVEAGRDIAANAGLIPVQIELGGNSAALVLEDADVDLAAQGVAWAGTYHSGQDCVGIKRVYVMRQVADDFLNRLTAIVQGLRPGIDYGPYISREARDEVKRRLDGAVKSGARLLCGGDIDPASSGNWMTPSVLILDCDDHEIVRKETFGNTVPVRIVDSIDEAVEAANATTYGLSNAVFSNDVESAVAIGGRLQSGMVFINDPFIAMPGWDHWTGWRQSGYGTVESKLMQCFKKKIISVNEGGQPRGFWYPYTAK